MKDLEFNSIWAAAAPAPRRGGVPPGKSGNTGPGSGGFGAGGPGRAGDGPGEETGVGSR